jgi:hypothetical protein
MDLVLFFFFSDPNTDLFCSCRAPVQNNGAIIFSPSRGGGGFSFFFYPVRVRDTEATLALIPLIEL